MAETPEALLRRYMEAADEDAAEALVRHARPRLLAAARRIVRAQDAEDAVHAAFLSLFHKGGAFDSPVMPWLITAVVRIAYRHRARERRQTELARRLSRAAPLPTPVESAARAEELRRLREGVDRLPERYRDAVVLHHLEGLSTSEVAGLLGISQEAVKKRLERGRRMLLGVLAPAILYPFLAAFWFLGDAAEASVRGLGAVAMKTKTAALLAGVALAAGAAGVGVGPSLHGKASGHEAAGIRAGRPVAETRIADLLLDIEAGREREAVLRGELEAARAATSPRGEAPGPAPSTSGRLPASLQAAAGAVGIEEAAIEAAVEAEKAIRTQYGREALDDDARRALKELEARGEQGFRAILTLLRSGMEGPWFERLLREAWRPGWEGHLMTFAGDPATAVFSRWQVLRTLGVADTPEVRRFLLDVLATESDAGLFMSAAGALGDLRETGAAARVEDKLLRPGWDGVRPHLLGALGRMGGPDARRILLEYLANARAGHLFYAVCALHEIDPVAGATEAARILASRDDQLSEVERTYFKQFASAGGSSK